MKLQPRQIPAFLAQPEQTGGVLIYGPDHGQIQQHKKRLISHFLPDMDDPFNRVDLSAAQLQEDPTRLYDELSALSFTCGRRVVLLRDVTDALADTIREALSCLSPTNYLLMIAAELPAKSALRALAESESRLAALPCYLDEGRDLEQFIRQTLQAGGHAPNPATLHYLSATLKGDRQLITQELEKLMLYFGEEKHWPEEALYQLLQPSDSLSVDELAFAIALGQKAKALQLMDRLLMEHQEPIAICRLLARHFMRLQSLIEAMQQRGISAADAVKQARPPIFFKIAPMFEAQLQRWSVARCEQIQRELMQAERQLKSGRSESLIQLQQRIIRWAAMANKPDKRAA